MEQKTFIQADKCGMMMISTIISNIIIMAMKLYNPQNVHRTKKRMKMKKRKKFFFSLSNYICPTIQFQ